MLIEITPETVKTMARRLHAFVSKARKGGMSHQNALEAVALMLGARDWNTLKATLETAAAKSPTADGALTALLEDWRIDNMGREEAEEELEEDELAPWTVEARKIAGGAFEIRLVDPVHDADDQRSRSIWIGIEIDRNVPKLCIAPDGADNLAILWAARDRVIAEPAAGDRIVDFTFDGFSTGPAALIPFDRLGRTG